MPRSASVPLSFPVKGLHADAPRGEQPLVYSPDLLNVRPQDVTGRLRGGQRPGMEKFTAAQMNGANPIQAMCQAVSIRDANAVVLHTTPPTALIDEPFTYGDQNLDSTANWETYSSSGTTTVRCGISTTASTALKIRTNRTEKEGTTANTAYGALWVGTPQLTNEYRYVIRATINLQYTNPMSVVQDVVAGTCKLVAKVDAARLYTSKCVQLVICRNFCALVDGEPALGGTAFSLFTASSYVAYYAFPNALSAGTHTVELRMREFPAHGTCYCEAYVDGLRIVSKTTKNVANDSYGDDYVGFAMGADAANNAESFDDFKVYEGVPATGSTGDGSAREVNIIAVVNGSIYVGDDTGTFTLAAGGTDAVSADLNQTISIAASRGAAYIVDGAETIKKVDVLQRQVSQLVATAGSLPEYCELATFWRDRLVLGRPRDNPQNFFMSRQGTHTDFDYGQEDEAAAVAGNAAAGAFIGEPLYAIMPFNDDELLLGGDSDIWRVSGDPAAGGSIDVVTESIGVLGPKAWCMDPSGTIWFLGTGGLYRVPPTGFPEPISRGVFDSAIAQINRSDDMVSLQWDRDQQGLYIFVTPREGGAATHYWFDARTSGLFPVSYPNNYNPYSSLVYDGDEGDDRFILLGGQDGYIRKLNPAALTDDGTAISSYVFLGPVIPASDDTAAILTSSEITFGELTGALASSFSITLTWMSGFSEYDAASSPSRTFTATYTGQGRVARDVRTLWGGAFFVKLSNATSGKTWSFEKVSLTFEQAGRRSLA